MYLQGFSTRKVSVILYDKTAPQLSVGMETSIPEGLIISRFKESHCRRIRTTNLPERVNRAITKLINGFGQGIL